MPDRALLAPRPRAYVDRIADVETWRRRGALTEARRLVEAALHADPYIAELHDAYARVLADSGELQLARDAWETALALEPGHLGALKGLGFLAFREGDLAAAERRLAEAVSGAPDDAGARAALDRVRAARSSDPPSSQRARRPDNAGGERGPPEVAIANADGIRLLSDTEGLVLAGDLGGADGMATRSEAACELSALASIVTRACEYLALGDWHVCLLDGEGAACVIGRMGPTTLVLTDAGGEAATGRVLSELPGVIRRAARLMGEAQ